MNIRDSLTFDDVLLVPKRSHVNSRRDIDTGSCLTNNIKLNIPIISANMDSVTEAKMAITLARLGGIGFLHRFMSIEDEVDNVKRIKRSENAFVEQPFALNPENTLSDAKEFMDFNGITGILVVNKEGALEGILTNRDILFEEDNNKKIKELMTKKSNLVTAPFGITLDDAKKILRQHRLEKLPLVDENFKVKGLITCKDIIKSTKFPLATKDKKGRLMVAASMGVKHDHLERAKALVEAGADALVVDIAHGHSDLAIKTIKDVKREIDIDIIAGNVATAQAVKDLIEAGADCVKIGIGPGSLCSTRIVAGAGVPQLTAIFDCVNEAKKHNIPTIADGGIKTSGDLTKALAAGANTVMLGSLLSGTLESPGMTTIRNGIKYKIYRGMAGLGAALGRNQRENNVDIDEVVPEGIEAIVPYKGSASEVIRQLIGGLRSGMSYCGSRNISEMHKNAEFIKISESGMKESIPHNIGAIH